MDMKYGRVGSVFSDPQLTGTANGVPIDELQEIIVEPSIENDMETGSIDVGSFE